LKTALHKLSERIRSAIRIARRRKQIETYLRTHSVRKLQLGTGSNVLEGWLNSDIHRFEGANRIVYLDARQRFPLPDESFDLVFCEHMLEHIDYADGLRCLRECRRVLRPGGRIRVATPSLRRLADLYRADPTEEQKRYVQWAVDTFVDDADAPLPGFVLNNFLRSWGHRFVYDEDTLRHALERAGFAHVEQRRVGESGDPQLVGLERHLDETAEFNEYETIVFEGRRP
jgi:predicted SAM-dependent methyltransferase